MPYLLGFHPAESLIVIGLEGEPPKGRLHLTVRWDLPLAAPGLGQIIPLFRKRESPRSSSSATAPARW